MSASLRSFSNCVISASSGVSTPLRADPRQKRRTTCRVLCRRFRERLDGSRAPNALLGLFRGRSRFRIRSSELERVVRQSQETQSSPPHPSAQRKLIRRTPTFSIERGGRHAPVNARIASPLLSTCLRTNVERSFPHRYQTSSDAPSGSLQIGCLDSRRDLEAEFCLFCWSSSSHDGSSILHRYVWFEPKRLPNPSQKLLGQPAETMRG